MKNELEQLNNQLAECKTESCKLKILEQMQTLVNANKKSNQKHRGRIELNRNPYNYDSDDTIIPPKRK